mgnify:CR=1
MLLQYAVFQLKKNDSDQLLLEKTGYCFRGIVIDLSKVITRLKFFAQIFRELQKKTTTPAFIGDDKPY